MADVIRACDSETDVLLSAATGNTSIPVGPGFDWSYFLELVRHHGMTGTLDLSFAPPEVVAEVERWRSGLVRRNLRSTGLLLDLVRKLTDSGLQVMAYKGPVLAELAYGSLGKRKFVDLDLFLRREQVAPAVQILRETGYVPRYTPPLGGFLRYHWEYPMVPALPSGLHVELQWRWSSLRSSRRPSEDWIWESPLEAHLGGARVLTPNIENYLLLLSQHGAGHRWRKLQWVFDLVGLIARHPVDWSALEASSRRLDCSRQLALGLVLAQDLGAVVPKLAILQDPVIRAEARWIGRWLLPIRQHPLPLREKLFDWRMRVGLGSKAEYLLQFLLIPAHEDLATWPLGNRALWALPIWRVLHQVGRLTRSVAHHLGLPVGLPRSGKQLASNPEADLPEL